jgi:hypothetical protein
VLEIHGPEGQAEALRQAIVALLPKASPGTCRAKSSRGGAMSFVVGLTGGIGSGKTTVAELFAHGAALVDTDAIAHELTAPQGAAMAAIAGRFWRARAASDGGLDRAAMRSLVFSDRSAKATLEAILHPLIREQSEARCAGCHKCPYVLLVVPLLVETGSYRSAPIGPGRRLRRGGADFPRHGA